MRIASLKTGLALIAVSALSGSAAFAQATSWAAQTSPFATLSHRSVHFPVDTVTGYIVGGNGKVIKTTNGGANWNEIHDEGGMILRAVQFPTNVLTSYAVGDLDTGSGTILKTVDGSTWVRQTSNTTDDIRGVHFPVDVGTGWAVGDGGHIVKTTDGGASLLSHVGHGGPGRRPPTPRRG